MNRLILIGNGFDLAHGLKTDYNSFIVWYLKKCLSTAFENKIGKTYEDELIMVNTINPDFQFNKGNGISDISDYVDFFYKKGLMEMIDNDILNIQPGRSTHNPFKIKIKSNFFHDLIRKCSYNNWVDIENKFYDNLKLLLEVEYPRKTALLKSLNNTLKVLIEELGIYLDTIYPSKFTYSYSEIFGSILDKDDIVDANLQQNEPPKDSLILNFNYTPTVENYFNMIRANISAKNSIKVNYIHGKIRDDKNPIIFGFGDELDSEYSKMELKKNNDFFEYIKSFWYFKTSNYHNLIRFIDTDEYQIFILGHSCGLSDRTLLNMIFEHKNCKSIKIFYYKNEHGYNNYKTLTQEISRHFKDKISMRKKIVPFDRSYPMPQVEID